LSERKRPVAMVEAGLLTALALVFTLVGMYVPFLGFFMSLVGIPLALAGIRNGLKIAGLTIAASSLLAIMIGGIPTGIYVLLVGGGTALVVTYCFEKNYSASKLVIALSIASIFAVAVSFKMATLLMGIDFFNVMDTSVVESMEMMKVFVQDEAQYQQMAESMAILSESVKILFPSSLAMSGVFLAIMNVLVLKAVLKRLKMSFVPAKPFNEFAFDKSVLIGTSLIMILSYVAGIMGIVDLTVLFANVVVIIAFAFSIQGAAVFDYFLSRRNLSRGIRVFIIAFLFIAFNGIIFIGMIGWFDVIFNFRKLERSDH